MVTNQTQKSYKIKLNIVKSYIKFKNAFQNYENILENKFYTRYFVYNSILFCIFFSLFIKYPKNLYGYKYLDNLYYHQLTNLILKTNTIPWIKSPFSYFGLYPVSNESGLMIFVASMSKLLNFNPFETMMPFTYFQTIISTLAIFVLLYEYKNNIIFSLFGTSMFSLTTRYVYYTYNIYSTRGFFITFLPFILFAVFKYIKEFNMKTLIILIIFSFIGLSLHLMGLFLIFLIIPYLFTKFFRKSISPIYRYVGKYINILNIFIIFIIIISFYVSYQITLSESILVKTKDVIWRIPEQFMFLTRSFLGNIILLFYSYGKYVGPFFPLTIIGFFTLLYKYNKNDIEYFLLFLLIIFIPISGSYIYVGPFLLIPLVICSSYSLIFLKKNFNMTKNKLFTIFFVTIVIIASIGYINLTEKLQSERDEEYYFDYKLYAEGIYLKYNSQCGEIMGKDSSHLNRILSITGGASKEYKYIDKFDYENVKLKPVDELIFQPHRPFRLNHWYWEDFSYNSPPLINRTWTKDIEKNSVQNWFIASNYRYHLVTANQQKLLTGENVRETIRLVKTTDEKRYKVYENDKNSIYYI